MISGLLIDEQPLLIIPSLAESIGLNEALILQQVHYRIEINRKANKNFQEGRYWTCNSMKDWHENNFPFWSYSVVQRIFSKLENNGYLISGNYNEDKFDKTKWYTINYETTETLGLLPIMAY